MATHMSPSLKRTKLSCFGKPEPVEAAFWKRKPNNCNAIAALRFCRNGRNLIYKNIRKNSLEAQKHVFAVVDQLMDWKISG